MGSFGTSLRLTAASFKLVFQYPVVLVLPFFTLLSVAGLIIGPISWLIWLHEEHPDTAATFWKNLYFVTYEAAQRGDWEWAITSAIIESFIIYAIWLSVALTFVLYFATVGMHVATTQIRHGTPKLGEGFQVATRNLGRIYLLALFNATVITWLMWAIKFGPLRWIPFAGKWLVRGVRLVLGAVTYLMLPIVIYERAGAWNAFRSAWTSVKKTWAGLLIGTGFVFFALWMLFNVFAFGVLQATFKIETWASVMASLIMAGVLYAVSISVSSALRAVLYWYATTGEVPAGFNKADLPTITAPGPITAVGAVAMAAPMAAPMQTPPPAAAAPYPAQPAKVVASRRVAVRPAASTVRQQMACPRCHTVIVVSGEARPVCPTCGYT